MIKEPPTRTEWMRIVNEICGTERNVFLPETFYGYIYQLLDEIVALSYSKELTNTLFCVILYIHLFMFSYFYV